MAYGLRLTAFHAPSFFASREEAEVVELSAAERGATVVGVLPTLAAEQIAFYHLAAARCGLRTGAAAAWVEEQTSKGAEWLARSAALGPVDDELQRLLLGLRALVGSGPDSPDDYLALAELLGALERPADAVAVFERALAADLSRETRCELLRAATAAAARVLQEVPDHGEGLRQQAFAWLDEDLRLSRERLAAIDTELAGVRDGAGHELQAERRAVAEHLAAVAGTSAELASLRALPEFGALLMRHGLDR